MSRHFFQKKLLPLTLTASIYQYRHLLPPHYIQKRHDSGRRNLRSNRNRKRCN